MNKAISIELQFFLISVIWGAIILFVYDGLRVLRRLLKHNSFFLAIEDLIFWVVASVFIFSMMYHNNNGIIRGFSIMGMSIGMLLYHYIMSEILVNLVTKFIHTLIRPFTIAFNKVKRIFGFALTKCKQVLKYLLLRLKSIIKSVKITLKKRKQKRALKREKITEKRSALRELKPK